jgi:hypothetical protein
MLKVKGAALLAKGSSSAISENHLGLLLEAIFAAALRRVEGLSDWHILRGGR